MKTKKKRAVIVIVSIILVIAIVVTILLCTNLLQKAIIRIMCKDQPSSVPDNYEQLLATTSKKEVVYAEGMSLDIIEPADLSEDAITVVYFHGGYYVGGGRHNQEPIARLIASYGYRVLNVDYSLAPESVYPTQLRQANSALNYAATNYPQSRGFVVSGDSAGAHLSAQLSAAVYNDSFDKSAIGQTILPSRLLGYIGNCGFFQTSTVEETRFPLVGSAMQMWVGQRNYRQSSVIEQLDLYNYVSAFPKTLLICGDKDPFIGQNKQFAQLLTDNKISVDSYFPISKDNDLAHEFQANYNLAESYIAMQTIVQFLQSL